MSNAMAMGFVDALVELDKHEGSGHSREQKEAIEKSLEENGQDEETKEKRRVQFRDDALTSEFDDKNLWARDPNESAQDMITAYQRECLVLKVKPIQNLLDQLKGVYNLSTPIDTIDLTGVRLDNKVCESLEAVLSRVHAKTLKLERTNLEDEGMIAVCEMVEFYGCASHVLVAYNNRLRPRAWLTIGRTLKKSPFLEMIDVSYCALDEQTLTLLLRAVRANCYLRVLKIEGNNLTGKGTFILMAAMKFNENLQELHLARNHLSPEDGQHLGSILRSNHTLRILDVSDNNLQDAGVRYICAGIAEQQEGLLLLNLSTNNLTHEGIHHVSAMLPCTKTLRELNISNNRFGDNGLYMLKLGLLANRSVEKLSLSCTRVTCEGAIALAEVLAESRYLIHVDLRENDIRVAGLMALCLGHRMNHSLLHLETPKTYKVEQRDRQLIRDLLHEIEQFRARNHKEKEERARSEQQRVHEASHKSSGAKLNEEGQTVGAASAAEEDEEEREVDPSLVGSLDNVLPDEQHGSLTEDPFKRAPVMDKESASSSEMEKTADALVVYSKEEDDCSSPTLDTNDCVNLRDDQDDRPFHLPATGSNQSRQAEHFDLDLLGPGNPQPVVSDDRTQGDRDLTGSQDLLPDLIGVSQQHQPFPPAQSSANRALPPDIQPSSHNPHSLPPDIAPLPSSLPPDLAANSQTPLDLLNPQAGTPQGLLDLTEGIASDSSSREY